MRYDEFSITENSLKSFLSVNQNIGIYLNQSKKIGSMDKGDIFLYSQDNQDLYILKNEKILSYIIIQNNSDHFWMMEIASLVQGGGYSTTLLRWILDHKVKTLYIDRDLTPDSVKMLEKMISEKNVKANIVDLKNGTIATYNPDKDYNIPMYDREIPGINRPILKKNPHDIVWMIEEDINIRGGLLSSLVLKDASVLP